MTSTPAGTLVPFMFDNMPARGKLIRLPNLTDQIGALHSGEDAVARLLAEMLAAAAMFTFDMKEKAHVTLQIHNPDSKLPLLVAKCSPQGALRAYAKKDGPLTDDEVAQAHAADSVFAVTVDLGKGGELAQSMVPIDTASISQSVETYFAQSAQLPTYFRVFTGTDDKGRTSAGALFLQAMPGKEAISEDDWRRLGLILSTIQPEEILPGKVGEHQLLRRLFAEDTVRVFPEQELKFTAEAARPRMAKALYDLGAQECRSILDEDENGGSLTMTDEYSGAQEVFTEADLKEIFGDAWPKRKVH